jgi:hypothetical protein
MVKPALEILNLTRRSWASAPRFMAKPNQSELAAKINKVSRVHRLIMNSLQASSV